MATTAGTRWFCFSSAQAATAQSLCEAVVPDSAPAGPAVYLDSAAADMPPGQRELLLGLLDEAAAALAAGQTWEQIARQPYFGFLRAQAIEAYYSDFRQPGYRGRGAWETIDFLSAPMAARAKQSWGFLRCFGGAQ